MLDLYAQSASPGPTPTPTDPKAGTVALSTFTVSSAKDRGYPAGNSITATGIGTATPDTPINILVVTSERE